MSLDFELDHRTILTRNLEVDVIVLSLDALLQRKTYDRLQTQATRSGGGGAWGYVQLCAGSAPGYESHNIKE